MQTPETSNFTEIGRLSHQIQTHLSQEGEASALRNLLRAANQVETEESSPTKYVTIVIVGALSAALLITVGGTLYLLALGRAELPNAIVALSSGILGALTGFLAPSPMQRR
jgi:hypothetical protein